ncbi:NADPH-dependent FMN reductase [Brucella anthropi]|uniref:NADPH-dependent FMN reductase n=1 Tax=Brucella anthropi TaxID=529 RepID=UPI000E97D2E1|nr:NAD(P)H-dependent oxidoreductase [Brucella anthropi]KAB2785180.1 NAD(P)H-dependent oxidoreductase [Brucella anthropi]QOD67121.1 NAD(P)H-dependent oxidoreductase [Ochrobactrum sp. MT180101]HBQ34118.1 FMN reductase [Brucella anthropi]
MIQSRISRRPFVLGIGGTARKGSSTERLLRASLAAAEEAGAEIDIVTGEDLLLPIYAPGSEERDERAQRMMELYRRMDGIIIATPAYHGSMSGLVKNALDYTEDLRSDQRVYFDDCAVGCICAAGGWQAAGQTLTAMRAMAHALRGWPTPYGAMVNTSLPIFDEKGKLSDESVATQLRIVARQVVDFATMRINMTEITPEADHVL